MSAAATRALRVAGWTLISAGVVVLLYLVYSLLFTNVTTRQAQGSLSEEWQAAVGEVDDDWELAVRDVRGVVAAGAAEDDGAGEPEAVDPGAAVAVLQFARPGSPTPPVHADPLYVVQGVALSELTRGPGHYPGTAAPGEDGNFAVAGHRTTYGAPFFNLDQLRAGDEVHVTARDGERFVYEVVEQRIVSPSATWVVGPDPLESDRPTLTLTTCNPRFSNAERLIVFAELVT